MQVELVERARSGDHDAFAVLAKESFGRLYGAAKLILRDQDRAQDAVQEALVLAWKHVRAIRDPQAWDAWLYRLTVRACYRLARSARRITSSCRWLGHPRSANVHRSWALARIIHEPLLRPGLFAHASVGNTRSLLVLDEHPGASLRGS